MLPQVLGEATALKLAAEGADLGLLDINGAGLKKLATKIEKNVADYENLTQNIQKLINHLGGLDVLHCNAGVNGTWSAIETLSVDDWDHVMAINLRSTFITVKTAIPYLKNDYDSSIIITSSINSNRIYNNFGAIAYSTSKAGQVAFMKMAALELARYNIRVNAICPGDITTNINNSTNLNPSIDEITIPINYPEGDRPLKEESNTSEQVANLVLFLASNKATNITGTELYIDGAESLLQ